MVIVSNGSCCYSACKEYYPGRYVTIAIEKTCFKKPVYVGDILTIYTKILKVGNTSIKVNIQTYLDRVNSPENKQLNMLVTEGIFTFVHIDTNRKPLKVNSDI